MEREKRITVNGIEATVVYKRVKNVRLAVLPPFGEVRVTASSSCPESLIRAFLAEKAGWIEKHRSAFLNRKLREPTDYASGETVTLFGGVYTLCVLEQQGKNGAFLRGDTLILSCKGSADKAKREAIYRDWCRERLTTEIDYLLPLWSEKTGLVPNGWTVRRMTSRWGSCNTQTKRITLNLQLIQYPPVCLSYVILHELAHLKVPGHGADFKAILDTYMPNWREYK